MKFAATVIRDAFGMIAIIGIMWALLVVASV